MNNINNTPPSCQHTAALIDDTFTYRETAAAEAPNPRRNPMPTIAYELLLLAPACYMLYAYWHVSPAIALLLPIHIAIRYIRHRRQDNHCYFFPSEHQQTVLPCLAVCATIAGILIYAALSALYRAAGGQSSHFLSALLIGAFSLLPLYALRHQWRILQKPLLSYQADNQTFVLYRWQDYRYTAAHTWPTDNFQGIALRALPIDRWQLLLLGKNGQADILLEEGAEKALRKRQKLLAQSSGMAMLEA